jgi:hypothetical protein
MNTFAKYSAVMQSDTAGTPNTLAERDNNGDVTARDYLATRTVRADGGFFAGLVSKTANYTLAFTETTVLFDATSGALTATLPPASGVADQIYCIEKIDSSANAVTIDPDSAETVSGLSSWVLYNQWDSVLIQSNASNWVVIGHKERVATIAKSTTFTVGSQPTDAVYICTVATGYTATLPTAASMRGVLLTFVKIDAPAAALTLDGDASELLNGAATNAEIDAQWDSLSIISSGTAWYIVQRKIT